MLQVVPNNKYTVIDRKSPDLLRYWPAVVKVGYRVLVIGGLDNNLVISTRSSVSSHNLKTNTWTGNLPKLNTPRVCSAACLLAGNVYVFAGHQEEEEFHSIEKIASVSLIPGGSTMWTRIIVSQNIFTRRHNPGVAALNDTEIAILGGWSDNSDAVLDVIVFDTTIEICH